MLFHSQVFVLGFLPLCLAGFFLLPRRADQDWALAWLLATSLVFHAWWQPIFTILLACSIAGNWLIGAHIARARPPVARTWFAGGVVANLIVPGWFKYAGFFWSLTGSSPLEIALPLAISFFTFQQIMFLSDCLQGRTARPLPYATFVAFFPHLIAGPLVRPSEVIPQLEALRIAPRSQSDFVDGLEIFLLGLGKKLVLADLFGRFADVGFNAAARGDSLTMVEAWYALLSYALQIYFDFSGYSDMAIGLARMLGVRFARTSTAPIRRLTSPRSGDAGTSRWVSSCGIFSTSRWAAVATDRGGSMRRC